MKISLRSAASLLLIFVFVLNGLPCGPDYISPVFENSSAPETPFENFAAGNLGIVKPTLHRSVLTAAYRYVNGGMFSAEEQKNLVEVWRAEFSNEDYRKEDVGAAVKAWIERRREVVGKEEKAPEIYTEREYGGYDFFPNCTMSAFETATETLSDRISAHGASDKNLLEWIKGQDAVFANCASGRQMPAEVDATMPEWLQKDRAYQRAAAEFYSLEYAEAKRRFAEIVADLNSPWQETADYLVGRTLIRQASLSKSPEKAIEFYVEAETILSKINGSGNKFAESAERMLGLIKYRLHPQERVGELAQKLSFGAGNANFRQDLIDYTWLLDKFEKETLEAEEIRKKEEKQKEEDANSSITDSNSATNSTSANISESTPESAQAAKDGFLTIYLYSDDYTQNWTFYVKPDATDEETLAEAEKVAGRPLSEEMKKRVREIRRTAYANRFSESRQSEYPGGYYGSEKPSLSLLPEFLRRDELTDWLFTYQIANDESYLYSLSKYKETNSDLWLMTALSKANTKSADLKRLLEAAAKFNRSSVAFPTIAFHTARIYIEQNKRAEAKKLLDELLSSSSEMPISSRNQFLDLRLRLTDTLEDYLKYSLKKPFAFDYGGSTGSIDDFISREKSYFDPKTSQQTQEEYEAEVEERFKEEKLWQEREMFDDAATEIFNQHFPLNVLLETEKSPVLPNYLRERFAVSIWTKAVLLEDYATAQKIQPELLKYKPELKNLMLEVNNAKTPLERQNAVLFLILKNPILTPYIETGLGRDNNEFGSFDTDDWWCAPYDLEYDDEKGESVPKELPSKPPFLTIEQSKAAQAERRKLKQIGDAPKFLGEKVLEWARHSPNDKRVPESLYIVFEANGWNKYGCGGNQELRTEIGEFLKKRYPRNQWTQKMLTDNEQ